MRPRNTSGVNALIGVDKPVGMTSHDVVARVRRALGERGVGHAGTLDPLASGVLVIGVGRATRLLGMATAEDKCYLARFAFGTETTTDDEEGEVRREAPVSPEFFDRDWAMGQMRVLKGMTEQVPPAYSAVSVNGVRAYRAAREGREMELAARPCRVLDAQVLFAGQDEDETCVWDLVVHVSKGTYVRALARDLGRALGGACHVRALRRTASGIVGVRQCVTPDALDRAVEQGVPLPLLDPLQVLGIPGLRVSDAEAASVRDGRRLRTRGRASSLEEGADVGLVYDGSLRAIARLQQDALVPRLVFPEGVAGVSDERQL